MISINKLSSNSLAQGVTKKLDSICMAIGSKLSNTLEKTPNKDKFISKFLRVVEPTGANNSFVTLATLMVGTVIIPRVKTAAKRNPDNKEATRDEIKEILFRDCQTVLIILFALKSMNSLIAGAATKLKGLPMVNKPYEALSNNEEGLKGFVQKGKDLIKHPLEKLKKIGKNLLNTINPTDGVKALGNDEFISKYSHYSSVDEIKNLIDSIPSQGGNKNKVFNMIMDSIIQSQKAILEGNGKTEGLIAEAGKTANKNGSILSETQKKIKNATEIKEAFEALKENGYEAFKEAQLGQREQDVLVNFFKNKDNTLVKEAKRLTAVLKTMALAIETIYLGFGLPALNQKRLERKYLKNNPNFKNKHNRRRNNDDSTINKPVKPHEIKLYHKFLK